MALTADQLQITPPSDMHGDQLEVLVDQCSRWFNSSTNKITEASILGLFYVFKVPQRAAAAHSILEWLKNGSSTVFQIKKNIPKHGVNPSYLIRMLEKLEVLSRETKGKKQYSLTAVGRALDDNWKTFSEYARECTDLIHDGIRQPRLEILLIIGRHRAGISLKTLAQMLGYRSKESGIFGYVNELEAQGIVRRVRSEGREMVLELNDKGKRLHESLERIVKEFHEPASSSTNKTHEFTRWIKLKINEVDQGLKEFLDESGIDTSNLDKTMNKVIHEGRYQIILKEGPEGDDFTLIDTCPYLIPPRIVIRKRILAPQDLDFGKEFEVLQDRVKSHLHRLFLLWSIQIPWVKFVVENDGEALVQCDLPFEFVDKEQVKFFLRAFYWGVATFSKTIEPEVIGNIIGKNLASKKQNVRIRDISHWAKLGVLDKIVNNPKH